MLPASWPVQESSVIRGRLGMAEFQDDPGHSMIKTGSFCKKLGQAPEVIFEVRMWLERKLSMKARTLYMKIPFKSPL